MRPSNTVYFVSPALIAATAASLMFGGVSKSGSPWLRLMMSRPAAFSSVASAVIAIVGDGLTRARRSARNGMMELHPKRDKQNTLPSYGFPVNPRRLAPSPRPGLPSAREVGAPCRDCISARSPGDAGRGDLPSLGRLLPAVVSIINELAICSKSAAGFPLSVVGPGRGGAPRLGGIVPL